MKAQQTPAAFFKTLPLMFLALLAGMVMMGTIMYVMNPVTAYELDFKNPFLIIMLIAMIAGIFGSNLLYNYNKNKIDLKDSTESKVARIQQAVIIRFAFVEGPALLGIILYLKESNLIFLMLSAMMVLYFLTLKPSKEKIIDDMNLTSEQKRDLE
ncbi:MULTISPECIES: hypothetical protein [Chryseobacterium]|uniref:Apolipoprotein N-acyltransferase n=1 Tax=Chryseobacterium geocarposphaerae TaxID=1416776 RepID=A0ABU1LHS5_9FLAO|nr:MULTISPECIES: hypothetical protein [Chryseobacterium]MDR6406271.1 apolipoprotein N-acyltransferase [Chryseobacterium geocarposphaerae]MDR6699708.1 apolipoprotein N-acyltransferase [Chryseobacterium ginsenosidimutans]